MSTKASPPWIFHTSPPYDFKSLFTIFTSNYSLVDVCTQAETEVAIAQEASTVSRLTRAEKALPLKAGELLMSSRGLARLTDL